MPALPPISNGCSLTVFMDQSGQEAVNVLGGYLTTFEAEIEPAEITRWLNAWWGTVRGVVNSSVTCTGAQYRDLSVSSGRTIDVGAPTSPAGLISGQVSTAAACFIIKWKTPFGGRSSRGRTFLPGVSEAEVDANGRNLIPSALTNAQGIPGAYLGLMQPADGLITPAVVSRKFGYARQINSGTADPIVGTQRRRMRR